MAGRYIPPHLRAKAQENINPNGASPDNINISASGYSGQGTRDGDRRSGKSTKRPPPVDEDLYSLKEIDLHFRPTKLQEPRPYNYRPNKTVHDSEATPGRLTYVLLFKDANPRWNDDGIIFAKSNLKVLPGELADKAGGHQLSTDSGSTAGAMQASSTATDETLGPQNKSAEEDDPRSSIDDQSTVSAISAAESDQANVSELHQPIAVFHQTSRVSANSLSINDPRCYEFIGYYQIASLKYLQPRTPELVDMLEQKWTLTNKKTGRAKQKERNAKDWEQSLSYRWAEIKFEKDEEADKTKGAPKIGKVLDDEEGDDGTPGKKKTVNEMLQELRLKDGNVAGNKDDGNGDNVGAEEGRDTTSKKQQELQTPAES